MDKLKEKILSSYDLWENEPNWAKAKRASKMHPSFKRTKKMSLPHPGQSYNPDPDDHQRLLRKIAQKEIEYQKKERSIRRSLKPRIPAKEARKDAEQELTSGIKHLIKKSDADNDSDGSSTESAYSDYDEKDFNAILKDKTVVERRKTRKQRLGQMRDKLQRKAAKSRKLQNIRMSKFDAIKKINKALDKQEKEAAMKQKHRKKIKVERLGTKLIQSDPIYCLGSDLPSNLREVHCPMGAIVREQLESFQSRLLVEPTKFQLKKRKYKKKEFVRKTAQEYEFEETQGQPR